MKIYDMMRWACILDNDATTTDGQDDICTVLHINDSRYNRQLNTGIVTILNNRAIYIKVYSLT